MSASRLSRLSRSAGTSCRFERWPAGRRPPAGRAEVWHSRRPQLTLIAPYGTAGRMCRRRPASEKLTAAAWHGAQQGFGNRETTAHGVRIDCRFDCTPVRRMSIRALVMAPTTLRSNTARKTKLLVVKEQLHKNNGDVFTRHSNRISSTFLNRTNASLGVNNSRFPGKCRSRSG